MHYLNEHNIFIFLILTPQDDDTQVQILSLIAQAIIDEQMRDAIMQSKDVQQIWSRLQESFSYKHVVKKRD